MKRGDYPITIGGKPWTLRVCNLKNDDGLCTPSERMIRISYKLPADQVTEIFIHEALHALLWCLDESFVEEAAKELVDGIHLVDDLL